MTSLFYVICACMEILRNEDDSFLQADEVYVVHCWPCWLVHNSIPDTQHLTHVVLRLNYNAVSSRHVPAARDWTGGSSRGHGYGQSQKTSQPVDMSISIQRGWQHVSPVPQWEMTLFFFSRQDGDDTRTLFFFFFFFLPNLLRLRNRWSVGRSMYRTRGD